MGIPSKPANLPLVGTSETPVKGASEKVVLSIKTRDNNCLTFTFYVVAKVICNLPLITPQGGIPKEFHTLPLADQEYAIPSKIDALLGLPIWIRIVEPTIIRSHSNNAVAQKTKVGYVIFQAPLNHESPSKTIITTTRAGLAATPHELT